MKSPNCWTDKNCSDCGITCSACLSGYYLDKVQDLCIICNTGISNCSKCSNSTSKFIYTLLYILFYILYNI